MSLPLLQVRAAAIFALGNLFDVGSDLSNGDDDRDDDEKNKAELSIVQSILQAVTDGSPLVRVEVAVGMWTSIISDKYKYDLYFLCVICIVSVVSIYLMLSSSWALCLWPQQAIEVNCRKLLEATI